MRVENREEKMCTVNASNRKNHSVGDSRFEFHRGLWGFFPPFLSLFFFLVMSGNSADSFSEESDGEGEKNNERLEVGKSVGVNGRGPTKNSASPVPSPTTPAPLASHKRRSSQTKSGKSGLRLCVPEHLQVKPVYLVIIHHNYLIITQIYASCPFLFVGKLLWV